MKLGAFGLRRYSLYQDVKTYAKKLPQEQQTQFYKALKEAK
jgi:hypothetical protein